jgi:hypothetical protein
MALSALVDPKHAPARRDLAATLGPALATWEELEQHVRHDFGPVTQQWHHGGEKYGWSMRLRDKKRVLVYLIPCQGHFLVGLVFGDRALEVIRRSDLPHAIVAMIEAAKPYAEGRGVRLEIRGPRDLASVKKLVAIKVES